MRPPRNVVIVPESLNLLRARGKLFGIRSFRARHELGGQNIVRRTKYAPDCVLRMLPNEISQISTGPQCLRLEMTAEPDLKTRPASSAQVFPETRRRGIGCRDRNACIPSPI